ncbi:hypothetical protein MMC17_000270 [Xylographa soralifera]|nr:hypothetical protein [Xylographa soralifera]
MTAPKPAQLRSKTREARIARRMEKRRLESPVSKEETARASARAIELRKQLKAVRLHNCKLFSKMIGHGLLHDKTAKYLQKRYSRAGQRAKFEAIVKAEKEGGNLGGQTMWKKLTEVSYWQEEEQTVPGWAKGRKSEDEKVAAAPEDEEDDEEEDEEDADEDDGDDEEVEEGKVEEKKWPETFELVIR